MLPENLWNLTNRRMESLKNIKRKRAADIAKHSQNTVIKVKWPKPGEKVDNSLVELSKFVDNEKLAVQLIAVWIDTVEKLKTSTREDLKEIKSPMYKWKLFKLLSI